MIIKKCNKCGNGVFNHFEIDYRFEYKSKRDGDYFQLHLCDRCLDECIDSFAEECVHNPLEENEDWL